MARGAAALPQPCGKKALRTPAQPREAAWVGFIREVLDRRRFKNNEQMGRKQ